MMKYKTKIQVLEDFYKETGKWLQHNITWRKARTNWYMKHDLNFLAKSVHTHAHT